MHNLYANFVRILDTGKQFSQVFNYRSVKYALA